MAVKRIERLEALARDMVGDMGSPDLFFVSRGGAIITITRDFDKAYQEWRSLTNLSEESALENRRFGVIADKAPDDDSGGRLRVRDDSGLYKRMKK